jgi:hypothetical protein
MEFSWLKDVFYAWRRRMEVKSSNRVTPLKVIARTAWLVLLCVIVATTPYAELQSKPKGKSSKEFAHLIQDMSEPDGYFDSDNFISNESSYLHVVDKLRGLGNQGGVYVGVGPDQNFTYIAKTRPDIAFVVDVRRQNMLHHLMYKAIFDMARTRSEYLSILFAKPLSGDDQPDKSASIDALVSYFRQVPFSETLYATNLARIKSSIKDKYKVKLSAEDESKIEYIYRAFCRENLKIKFTSFRRGDQSFYPNLEELMLETDLKGNHGHYLNSNDDFNFLKQMQQQNLIIPIVGNFAGEHALTKVAKYVRANKQHLATFYVSNVEFYLLRKKQDWDQYVANVQQFPYDNNSVFIRAYFGYSASHPEQHSHYRMTTVLQKINSFVQLSQKGMYQTYWDVATLDYLK